MFVADLIEQRRALFDCMTTTQSASPLLAHLFACLPNASPKWTEHQLQQVLLHTRGRNKLDDCDHVPVLVAQATSVPSRPRFILAQPPGSMPDPAPQLAQVACSLASAGATHLAIVCNTAHHFLPQMKQQVESESGAGAAQFLDLIQLTLDFIRSKHPGVTRLGVLATKGTLQCGLIQKYASASNRFRCFSPLDLSGDGADQDQVEECIFGDWGIKAGYDSCENASEHGMRSLMVLLEQCALMRERFEVEAVVLFCSELPLLLNPKTLQRVLDEDNDAGLLKARLAGIEAFVDPSMVLVHEVLRMGLVSRKIHQ